MNHSSSRQRIPTTGRSNISTTEIKLKTKNDLPAPNISNTARIKLNDSLQVFKPFTPEIKQQQKIFPPILPNSRYPTIPPNEPEKRRRPLSCTESWILRNQSPNKFERSALNATITNDEKEAFCKEFIERNQNRLWKYDLNYMDKTSRTVYNELINDNDFKYKTSKFHDLEHKFNISSSDQLNEVLTDKHKNTVDKRHLAFFDPFASTITTSRNDRNERIKNMFSSYMLQHGNTHQRGFNHAPEYGNFSKYNAVLKVNEDAALKR